MREVQVHVASSTSIWYWKKAHWNFNQYSETNFIENSDAINLL